MVHSVDARTTAAAKARRTIAASSTHRFAVWQTPV